MRIPVFAVSAFALAGFAAAAIASSAHAQSWEAERARMEAQQRDMQVQMQAQADLDRMNAQAAQRDLYAQQDRLRSAVTLQQLEQDRYMAQQRRPLAPPPNPRARAALDAQMQADNARMDALTNRLLRESNARVRAIKPASER